MHVTKTAIITSRQTSTKASASVLSRTTSSCLKSNVQALTPREISHSSGQQLRHDIIHWEPQCWALVVNYLLSVSIYSSCNSASSSLLYWRSRQLSYTFAREILTSTFLFAIFYLPFARLFQHQRREMDRKVTICHICGAETKRFSDHLASAHHFLDHKNEKVRFHICY